MSIVNRLFESLVTRGGNGDGPSLDRMLAQFDKELANFETLVQPAPESKPRTPFDGNVPPNTIFQHKGIPHEFALVFTVEMDKEKLDTAPSFEAFKEVARGYKNLAVIGNKLARFMRRHGFAAYPGTELGGLTDYCYLAELAGMGAIGYHGLLITPKEGARLRINTIYTNITKLPIETENTHLWVRDFCAMCRNCIRKCPVDAIFDRPRLRGDGGMQCIEHDTCRDYFNQNFGCAICLVVYPFSGAGYDKIRARFKGNPAAAQFPIPLTSETMQKVKQDLF